MNKNDERVIVYLGGGAMSGCYGAGVLKGLYDRSYVGLIEDIYAGSVGSMNASYLLSNQAEIGPTIYFEDLLQKFIFPWNIFIGTVDLVLNRFIKRIKKEKAHNVVDINYICNILTDIKRLDLNAIISSPINLYIKILNINTGEVEYKSFKDHPTVDLLKAATAVKPYFFEEILLGGNYYIDGTIKDPIGIDYLLNKYPYRKIIVVLNEPIHRGFRHYLKNFVEGIASSLYPYNISLFRLFLNRENMIRKDIQICLANKRVLLLYPNFRGRTRPRTTKLSTIKKTFEDGAKDCEKIIDFINMQIKNS